MGRRLLGTRKPCAHRDAFRPKRHGGQESASVRDSARGGHRDRQGVGELGDQGQGRDLVHAVVAAGLEALAHHDVRPCVLGLQAMLHAGHDMDPEDARRLPDARPEDRGISGARDDHLDSFGQRDLEQLGRVGAEERNVHRESPLRERLGLPDLGAEELLIHAGGSDCAQDLGLGARHGELVAGGPDHARLHDGVPDLEEIGDAGADALDQAIRLDGAEPVKRGPCAGDPRAS